MPGPKTSTYVVKWRGPVKLVLGHTYTVVLVSPISFLAGSSGVPTDVLLVLGKKRIIWPTMVIFIAIFPSLGEKMKMD